MGDRLQVEPFARFEELVRIACGAQGDWASPRQVTYLLSYLKNFPGSPATWIVVEKQHTDRHYLDEYTAYYATLLFPPSASTVRLHFFTGEHSKTFLSDRIQQAAGGQLCEVQASLSQQYLGYVTIRPISGAPIGRTVLKHYEGSNGRRYDPVIRECSVRVAGLQLRLDALPFFQQDRGVGACATAALWAALAAASRRNGMRAPTPYAVTAAATKNLVTDRPLPATSGLELAQLANAMREHGLSPYTVKVGNEPDLFLWTLKSYLRSGVPAVLFLRGSDEGHAVVVAGYKERSEEYISMNLPDGRTVRTTKLVRVFVHDDRIGPYVKMDLGVRTTENGWKNVTLRRVIEDEKSDEELTRDTIVSYALFPLYPKLRMSAPELAKLAAQVSPMFRFLLGRERSAITVQTWFAQNGDYLAGLYRLRAEAGRVEAFATRARLSRYVGVARFYLDDAILADVVCDTTDIHREDLPYGSIVGVFFAIAKHADAAKTYQDFMPKALIA